MDCVCHWVSICRWMNSDIYWSEEKLLFWVYEPVFRRHTLVFTVCETQAHHKRFYMNHTKSNKIFCVNSFVIFNKYCSFFPSLSEDEWFVCFFFAVSQEHFSLPRKQNKPSESLSQQCYKKNTLQSFCTKKNGYVKRHTKDNRSEYFCNLKD